MKSYSNLLSAFMALVLSIPTVDGVNVRFKLPATNAFLEAAEATARARKIMAAAENADKLEDNTHAQKPLLKNVNIIRQIDLYSANLTNLISKLN